MKEKIDLPGLVALVLLLCSAVCVGLLLGHNRVFGSHYRNVQLPSVDREREAASDEDGAAEPEETRLGLGLVTFGDAEKQFLLRTVNVALKELRNSGRPPEPEALEPVPSACRESGTWALFMTLYAPAKQPLRVIVQEQTLLKAALLAAESAFKHPGYRMRRFDRDHRVRIKIDILKDLRPLEAQQRPLFSMEPLSRIIGLQVVRGDSISYTLPSDVIRHNVTSQLDLLRIACARAGLPPYAWREDSTNISVLTTTSFVNRRPNSDRYFDVVRAFPLVTELNDQKLFASLMYGGHYLTNSQYHTGQFTYNYVGSSDKADNTGYNVVRHAGVCYSLYQLYGFSKSRGIPNETYKNAADHGLEYLSGFAHLDKRHTWMFISKKREPGDTISIGASALGAVALLERRRHFPEDTRYETLTRLLLQFLMAMQSPNGQFRCVYDFKLDKAYNTPALGAANLYFPGEATLALVLAAKVFGDPEYLDAARRSLDYLSQRRDLTLNPEVEPVPPHDHWACIAIQEMSELEPRKHHALYAYGVARSMSRVQFTEETAPARDFVGGKGPLQPPSVCATATDLEAYTGAYIALDRWADQDPEMQRKRDECLTWARRAGKFVLSNQFLPENAYFIPNPSRALGGIHGRPTTTIVRNDYVQHAICGLIKLTDILNATKAETERPQDGPQGKSE